MTFRRIRHHYVYVFTDCAICQSLSFLTSRDSQQRIFPIGFIFLKLPPPPRAALLVLKIRKRRFLLENPPFLGAFAVSFREEVFVLVPLLDVWRNPDSLRTSFKQRPIPETNPQKPWESPLRWVTGGEVFQFSKVLPKLWLLQCIAHRVVSHASRKPRC